MEQKIRFDLAITGVSNLKKILQQLENAVAVTKKAIDDGYKVSGWSGGSDGEIGITFRKSTKEGE